MEEAAAEGVHQPSPDRSSRGVLRLQSGIASLDSSLPIFDAARKWGFLVCDDLKVVSN
jgi:hypothetical protein